MPLGTLVVAMVAKVDELEDLAAAGALFGPEGTHVSYVCCDALHHLFIAAVEPTGHFLVDLVFSIGGHSPAFDALSSLLGYE
jgi:hypothetical protein